MVPYILPLNCPPLVFVTWYSISSCWGSQLSHFCCRLGNRRESSCIHTHTHTHTFNFGSNSAFLVARLPGCLKAFRARWEWINNAHTNQSFTVLNPPPLNLFCIFGSNATFPVSLSSSVAHRAAASPLDQAGIGLRRRTGVLSPSRIELSTLGGFPWERSFTD